LESPGTGLKPIIFEPAKGALMHVKRPALRLSMALTFARAKEFLLIYVG
jgi:hypothetical protein